MRAEHWYDHGKENGAIKSLSRLVAKVALGLVPDAIIQFFRKGQVVPLPKANGEYRPLLLTSFLRRLALKTVMKLKKHVVADVVGKLQYGVGMKDGANKLIKCIQVLGQTDDTRVLVALDLKAAFQNVSRKQVMKVMKQADPMFAVVFQTWYTGSTEHRARFQDASFKRLVASSGLDQGCALAAFGFAAATNEKATEALQHIRSNMDGGADMFCYLDDWYLWVQPSKIEQAVDTIARAVDQIGLQMQSSKMQIWRAKYSGAIPEKFQNIMSDTMNCLGGHLKIHGDTVDAGIVLGNEAMTMSKTKDRMVDVANSMKELHDHGLPLQTALALLRTYVGAASQHALRMSFVTQAEADNFDNTVIKIWSLMLGRNIENAREMFFMKTNLGGMGVASAVDRRLAAPWTAWQAALSSIQEHMNTHELGDLFVKCPELEAALRELQVGIGAQAGLPGFQVKTLVAAIKTKTTQKQIVEAIHKTRHKSLLAKANIVEKAIMRSCAAPNAGAFLNVHGSESYEMHERPYQVAIMRRLMLDSPAELNDNCSTKTCPNILKDGRVCGTVMDRKAIHATICKFGGGVVQRHDAVVRCLADIIQNTPGIKTMLEQYVPSLDKMVNGKKELARMDIVFMREGFPCYVDVVIVSPVSSDHGLMNGSANKEGYMLKRAERAKHARYDTDRLVPFAMEVTGRPGPAARKFINELVKDSDDKGLVTSQIWSCLSSVLQSAVSMQQIKACGCQ